MKRYLLVSLSVVLLILAGFYLSKHLYCVPEEHDPDATAKSVLVWNQCLQCHSENPSLPFYGSFPVISGLLARDIEQGYIHADLKPFLELLEFRTQLPEAMLAKIEQTVIEGSMPPVTYSAVHWGKGINAKEKALLLDWIYKKREVYYVSGLAAEPHTYAMVQPLFDSLEVNHKIAVLGEKLFNDVRLSVDNTVSCATCHGLETGGVDRKPVSEGIRGLLGTVNAPTVYNAAYNLVQFWDGRAVDLQQQAAGPPLNPVEMGSVSWDSIVAKFPANDPFTQQFLEQFPEGVSEKTITAAIAEYEKLLTTPDSRFDQYLKGKADALSEVEKQGYELFQNHRCATCHVGMLMGGQSFEKVGLKADYFADRGKETIDADYGLYNTTKREYDRFRLKTPTLRNVALTPPYFHDATSQSLEEALEAMLKYQTGTRMTLSEKEAVVQFLHTLTGYYQGKLLE